MTKNKIDFIILGGGCSALSLINNIIKKKINNYSFLIIEKRQKYNDDKSWCFWDKNNSQYKNLTESNWDSFSFNYKKKSNILNSSIYKYFYIRSSVFYENSLKAISNNKNITLKLNESILEVKNQDNNYLVITNKAKYLSKNILDTRNNINVFNKDSLLYQCFLGYEIKLNRNTKYNPSKVLLMHDMQANKDFFSFSYILPLKKDHILYEFTTFSKSKLSKSYLEKKLKEKLKNSSIKISKIIKKEFGIIPMGFINKKNIPKKSNFFYAGTAAGAVRPSSGYAFFRIQQWAEKASIAIKKNGSFISHPKEKILPHILDKILLKIILNNPQNTPEIFFSFTKNISANSFVRFMSGNANVIDYFKVILAMPKKIILKCLIEK